LLSLQRREQRYVDKTAAAAWYGSRPLGPTENLTDEANAITRFPGLIEQLCSRPIPGRGIPAFIGHRVAVSQAAMVFATIRRSRAVDVGLAAVGAGLSYLGVDSL